MSDNPLAALAMRERAAKQVGDHGEWMKSHNLLGNGFDFAGQAKAIRALPTTFTNAELLAAAMQLPEGRALVEAAQEQSEYLTLCGEDGDLLRNTRAALAPFMKGAS